MKPNKLNLALVLALLWVGVSGCPPAVRAATHALSSGRVAVDTRDTTTYTISGRLLMGGNPVANAEVTLENTIYKAVSDAAGYFAITNVPPGYKYTLVAAAQGTEFYRKLEIDVVNAAVNLGDLLLAVLTGPYKLVPLSPDVNPAVSEAETDGVLFRHYQVLTQNGNLPAPLASFTVRRADGTTVPQFPAAENAFAIFSGTADWTGMLRVRVPAEYLAVGSLRRFEILEGSTVRASFQAKARPMEWKKVYKVKAGASESLMVDLVSEKSSFGGEVELTETCRAGAGVLEQKIKSGIFGDLKVGVELGAGTTIQGGIIKGEAGAKVGAKIERTYRFEPDSSDPEENALKLYAVASPLLKLVLAQQPLLLNFVEQNIEPAFIGDHLESAQGSFSMGKYVQAKGTFKAGGKELAGLGGQAKLKGEGVAKSSFKWTYLPPEESGPEFSMGLKMAASGGGSGGIGSAWLKKYEWGVQGSFEAEGKATLWQDSRWMARKIGLSLDLECAGGDQVDIQIPGVSATLNRSGVLGVNTKMVYDWRSQHAPAFWADLAGGDVPIDDHFLVRLVEAHLQSSLSDWWEQEQEVYLGARVDGELEFEHSAGAAGVGVGISGKMESGVKRVMQRNRMMRAQSYPVELNTAQLGVLLAEVESIQQKVSDFVERSASLIGPALNQTIQAIAAGANTIQVLGNDVQGALDVAAGTLAAGTEVAGSILSGGASGGGSSRMAWRTLGADVLPPTGASNFVYGVGGIISFASSNSLTGEAMLRLSYTDEQIAGLDETGLRIYRFDNASGTWSLVGGTVDAESNVVTASITELGAFALAPPMPNGPLPWSLSADSLAADGTSVVTVQVANIALNTGDPATNAWLFTVLENGATVLNEDGDTNAPGVQVASSNAALDVVIRAPNGGTEATITILCAAGGASATIPIPLADDGAPDAPSGLALAAGQSRLVVSWASNASPDAVSHRIHYRKGAAGPPYDGVAAVEGQNSPATFPATARTATLRGLDKGATYHVAVSAVDGSGNESAPVSAGSATTTEQPPMPPAGVAVTFGADGTNLLMWGISEDDGFNDRDVIRYDVYRAILPGGDYHKVGETRAGVGMYVEPAPVVLPSQFVRYAVKAIDVGSLASDPEESSQLLPGSWGVDNDGDGIDDDWETRNGLDPLNPLDANLDDDKDGYSNRQEYEAGTDAQDKYSFLAIAGVKDPDAGLALRWESAPNRVYSIGLSTNLPAGFNVLESALPSTPPTNLWVVPGNATQLYYRIGVKRQ